MYTNFTEYWEEKKEIYTKLNVSREIAYGIWCDCAGCIEKELMKTIIKKR